MTSAQDPATIVVDWSEPHGISWTPALANPMELHAHALRSGDDVWLIDPFDGANLDAELAKLGGTVRQVVVLLDRHQRDAVRIAERHGATLHVVAGNIRQSIPDECERFDDVLDGSPFTVVPVLDKGKLWVERALWWPEHEMLVVAEAVGSSDGFRMGTDTAIAVHPLLRLTPPRAPFAGARPKTILFGHGPAVTVDAAQALATALAESRTNAPNFVVGAARSVFDGLRT